MTFKTLTGSIKFYYQSRNRDCPVTKQPAVSMMLEGCMRNAAKGREKVKKATVLENLVLVFGNDGSQTKT